MLLKMCKKRKRREEIRFIIRDIIISGLEHLAPAATPNTNTHKNTKHKTRDSKSAANIRENYVI